MIYSDIDSSKKAFVFELDNVLYPEKDYLLQVYYLFAGFIEYTEMLDAPVMLKLMTETFYAKGHDAVFDEIQSKFKLDEKYRGNFEHLLLNAKLPLPLLLYKEMLALLQEIVVDRKKIFLVTRGNPQLQLNKIKQTEWHGMGEYLTCYFADEYSITRADLINSVLLKQHNLSEKDVVVIGTENKLNEQAAEGIFYIDVENFLTSH